jgi:DNA-binding Xre family transcriptional regulator
MYHVHVTLCLMTVAHRRSGARAHTTHRGEAFATLIRVGMARRRISAVALAAETGIRRNTIGHWVAGRATAPYPDHVRTICAALDIPVEDALIALGYLDATAKQAA